jgi:hypothetical protein
MALPRKTAGEKHSCVAVECPIEAAEGRGLIMLGRIGMMRGLNHGKVMRARAWRTKAYRIVS